MIGIHLGVLALLSVLRYRFIAHQFHFSFGPMGLLEPIPVSDPHHTRMDGYFGTICGCEHRGSDVRIFILLALIHCICLVPVVHSSTHISIIARHRNAYVISDLLMRIHCRVQRMMT